MNRRLCSLLLMTVGLTFITSAAQADMKMETKALPPLPSNLPSWITNTKLNKIFYKRGPYNFDIYNIKPLAYDLNAVAVGHAMAYEDLVTGKEKNT